MSINAQAQSSSPASSPPTIKRDIGSEDETANISAEREISGSEAARRKLTSSKNTVGDVVKPNAATPSTPPNPLVKEDTLEALPEEDLSESCGHMKRGVAFYISPDNESSNVTHRDSSPPPTGILG